MFASVPQVQPARKDPGLAVALALIGGLLGVFGIGQIYAGKTTDGVVMMILAFLAFGMFLNDAFPMFPLFWIVGMVVTPIRAYKAAQAFNRPPMAGYFVPQQR